jgi:hypothetical protein
MFTTHYLDHPQEGDSKVLDGWSYFWGSLGGPIYVFAKGFPRQALLMVLITIGIFLGAALLVGLAVIMTSDSAVAVIAVVAIGAMAFVGQGMAAVELVRIGYIKRGYREGYY